MEITEITPQKRKDRFNIFVDGEFFSGLDREGVIKAGLKVGLKVDKKELEELVLESEVRSAFEKCVDLVSRKMYSEKELKDKLLKRGYGENVALFAIGKLREYGYISDQEFAKSYVGSHPLKSKMELKNSLFLKGINSKNQAEALEELGEEEEAERAKIIAEKYMKNREVSQKNLSSLYQYLSRRGFSSLSKNRALALFKGDEVVGENYDWD